MPTSVLEGTPSPDAAPGASSGTSRGSYSPGRHIRARLLGLFFVIAVAATDINLRAGDVRSSTPSGETIWALIFWFLTLSVTVPLLPAIAKAARTLSVRLAIALLLFGLATAPLSADPFFSLASVSVHTVVLAFAVGVSVRVRSETIVILTFVGASLYSIGSLALYFLVPELGLHHDEIYLGSLAFHRMAGLSHPNKVAFVAVLGLGAWITCRPWLGRWRMLSPIVISLFVCTLALAYSRTTVIAALVATGIMTVRTIRQRVFAAVAAAAVLIPMVVRLYGSVSVNELAVLSRQGTNAQEVLTLSGRTLIWATALDYVKRRPWIGWGFASNRSILTYEFGQGSFVPDQAHNLWLNSMMTTGVVSLIRNERP